MSDRDRTKDLYDYLVHCFANHQNRDGNINRRALGRRLVGLTTSKDEESTRLLAERGRGLADKFYSGRPITTSDLVNFIAGLQASGNPEQGQRLTPEEVLIALLKLVNLTPAERTQLGLSSGEEEVLLQQVLLNIWLNRKQDYGKVLKLYRTSIGLDEIQEEQRQTNHLREYIDDLIQQTAEQSLEYLPDSEYKQRQLRELAEKAKREVDRILLKGGAGQIQFESPRGDDYIRAYLPDAFIKRLTKAVIENELLTQVFPIHIKTITIQECAPLPLPASDRPSTNSSTHSFTGSFSSSFTKIGTAYSSEPPKLGLFYAPFLECDRQDLQGKEIASQYAHKVTVHFYIRLPASYQPPEEVSDVFDRLRRDDPNGQRIDFSMSSTGIGGTLSHIIKIINSTLLSNIRGLADYFPIAHDVVVHEEIIRNNVASPIWAHTLVQLCKTKTLAKAMSASSAASKLLPYEQFAFGDRIGRGDYCGFDLILCPANAALQARLRAIRYTGITLQQYLKDLTDRILQQRCLQAARGYVQSYPFSSFAQESYLQETLLRDLSDLKQSEYIRIEACLTIAETYLNEGMYRRAKSYLDAVGDVVKRLSDSGLDWYQRFGSDSQLEAEFEVFSGTLLVHFELCRALYFYFVDREAERGKREYLPKYIPQDTNLPTFHETLLKQSWEALNRAEKHLTIRLAKYFLIHEVSQGTFHPHYHFLAKIYFLRARILTFFPEVPYEDSGSPHRLPTDRNFGNNSRSEGEIHAGRLYLLEKARLYAASDGDTERYSCYTAYQSWIYWIVYFAARQNPRPLHDNLPRDCNLWAQQLRDHALLSYSEVGRKCYYQIKEKSGVQQPSVPNLRNYEIGPIPPIVETRKASNTEQQEDGEALYLDMAFLGLRRGWLKLKDIGDTNEVIYIFGPKASYLLFARGMYQLCSPEKEEFVYDAPARTVADWDEKLKLAYRLFSYSWAMADGGGTIEMVREVPGSNPAGQPHHRLRIKRSFAPSSSNGYNRDVASVRDLYPNQLAEMNDLGQVFAAACAALRLYIVPAEERETISQDINWLLQNLQKREFCAQSGIAPQFLEQPCLNGHLATYLDRCKQILQDAQRQAQRSQTPTRDASFVAEQRDALVRKLFNALHQG